MIDYQDALEIVLSSVRPLADEEVSLDGALGRVLAKDIVTPFPLPRFDNSAVDGYGVRRDDFIGASTADPIPVVCEGTIYAGAAPDNPVSRTNAVRIMTGAPVPQWVDAVVMREFVEQNGGLFISSPPSTGENIRRAGEELPAGATILHRGTPVTPPVVGVLATIGSNKVLTHQLPRVSVIVTGDELTAAGTDITDGAIFDANGPALAAVVQSMGITDVKVRRVKDDVELLSATLADELAGADVVITSGGVSVGDKDFVRHAAESNGAKEHFWRVAIKPGKPTYFGEITDGDHQRYIFGLPGNPVAVLVTFELFVKPALWRLKGHLSPRPVFHAAVLTDELHKMPKRMEFVRAKLHPTPGSLPCAKPVRGQGSHMLSGLALAECLIKFPREASRLEAGAIVDVLPLKWSLL